MKMNSKIKKLWLKALRSGKYEQGRGQLKTEEDKFCCLGILCDIHSKETKTEWDRAFDGYDEPTYLGHDDVLPQEVLDWAELDDDNPMVKDGNRKQHPLATFNDGDKYEEVNKRTFKQIANYIEKSL